MPIHNIAWYTDVHLNFLKFNARQAFFQSVAEVNADAILLTGDIAEGRDIIDLLTELCAYVDKPIYFVLGNHDYYHSSVAAIREQILKLCMQNPKLHWLGKPEIVALNNDTVLVGHDGWADARYGDFDRSPVTLNDSRFIAELEQGEYVGRSQLKKVMQALADGDAKTLSETLAHAINADYKKVIIATHVPPYEECAWHDGKQNDNNFQPFFASKATGDVITDVATKNPKVDFLVLCGHTHTAHTVRFFKNLEVRVGGALYNQPKLQQLIDLQTYEGATAGRSYN